MKKACLTLSTICLVRLLLGYGNKLKSSSKLKHGVNYEKSASRKREVFRGGMTEKKDFRHC